MGLLQFTAAPVDLNKGIKRPKPKKIPNVKRNAPSRKVVDSSTKVFGDELFQAAYKPARAIVVKFHPFTLSLVRMDFEGRFAIQYFKTDDQAKGIQPDKFLLYRFFKPLEYEYKEDNYQIELNENVKVYGPFEFVDPIRDKILEILKRELFEEKEAAKKLAMDVEKQDRLAKDKANDEADKLTEQLAATGKPRDKESDQRETENASKESSQDEEVLQEASEEKVGSSISLEQIRKPTADFLTKTDEIVEEMIEELEWKAEEIVSIMKRENNQVKFVTKMPKTKALIWIEGKTNFFIGRKVG